MVEPAHVDAARRKRCGWFFSAGRRAAGASYHPSHSKLDQMPVRIAELEGRAVAKLALDPADLVPGALVLAPVVGELAGYAPGRPRGQARGFRACQASE